MIELRSEVHLELVSFLKTVTGNNVPVYNTDALSNTPNESTRIEYRLANFNSTGQIYNKHIESSLSFHVSSISEYRCQLIIKAIGTPLFAAEMIGRISGGMQTHGYLEQMVNALYIKNETIKTNAMPVKDNGILYNINQLKVDCYVGVEFEYEVDYFDTLVDVQTKIINAGDDEADFEVIIT